MAQRHRRQLIATATAAFALAAIFLQASLHLYPSNRRAAAGLFVSAVAFTIITGILMAIADLGQRYARRARGDQRHRRGPSAGRR